MARLKYWRYPSPIPDPDDLEGLGHYWLKVYNAGGWLSFNPLRAG